MPVLRLGRLPILLLALPLLLGGVLSGCTSGKDSANDSSLAMASMDDMPAEVQSSATTVQEAYRFAVANPDVLKQIPCYCGCGAMGHTSNYACYVSDVAEDGTISFDSHALGCSICVDITQDTMRMLRQGQSVEQIRAAIDQTYAQYGPSNIP